MSNNELTMNAPVEKGVNRTDHTQTRECPDSIERTGGRWCMSRGTGAMEEKEESGLCGRYKEWTWSSRDQERPGVVSEEGVLPKEPKDLLFTNRTSNIEGQNMGKHK